MSQQVPRKALIAAAAAVTMMLLHMNLLMQSLNALGAGWYYTFLVLLPNPLRARANVRWVMMIVMMMNTPHLRMTMCLFNLVEQGFSWHL